MLTPGLEIRLYLEQDEKSLKILYSEGDHPVDQQDTRMCVFLNNSFLNLNNSHIVDSCKFMKKEALLGNIYTFPLISLKHNTDLHRKKITGFGIRFISFLV